MRRFIGSPAAFFVALFFMTAWAAADVAYYRVPLRDLALTEGKLPEKAAGHGEWTQRDKAMQPRVVIDAEEGPGHTDETAVEAYVSGMRPWLWSYNEGRDEDAVLVVRAPDARKITGRLFVPAADFKSMVEVRFAIPASAADANARNPFFNVKRDHYEALLSLGVPGAAWFRHQSRQSAHAMDQAEANSLRPPARPYDEEDLDGTYSLFTGGRALSESLQLDRVLTTRPVSAADADTSVRVDSIKGITVPEMDWKALNQGKQPQGDPLASLIPADQHVIFFPGFQAMTDLFDEADRHGTPAVEMVEPRSEDAGVKIRYQRQLCLPLTALGRLLGPSVIASVAMTGSDPYLRVGSDVAIVFQPKGMEPAGLHDLLKAHMVASVPSEVTFPAQRGAAVDGKVGGVTYTGVVSPDRSICAYLANIGNSVVITNSLYQLQRMGDVQAGKSKAIDTTPEYTFFRDRYKRGEGGESGFVVLTDSAIRRWCSAKWRIADSRRTRAAALMAELQATYLDDLAKGDVKSGPIHDERGYSEAGELQLTPTGITSSIYGNLQFMTPIAELDLTNVTKSEADNYGRWRDTYQQNWSNYFDPIAIRLSVSETRIAADLTVMPLIANSEYADYLDVTKGAKILPGTGDPHDALLHWAVAINVQSLTVQKAAFMASAFAPQLKVNPLGWMGQTIALYFDDDPAWQEAAKSGDVIKYFTDHFDQLPLALSIQSASSMKLAVFLTALHGFVDQSAPGMTDWTPEKYNEQPYVKITATAKAKAQEPAAANVSIYYTTVGEGLLLTPNEALLKRAMDRAAVRAATQPSTQPLPIAATQPAAMPWLGESLCLQANLGRLLSFKGDMLGPDYAGAAQAHAWNNIPILNEWKRRFPKEDPVKFQERFWQVRLIDPAGGSYVWNEKLQTMESTEYGCPEAPKPGAVELPELRDLKGANMGVSFEEKGLRAKAQIMRTNAGPGH